MAAAVVVVVVGEVGLCWFTCAGGRWTVWYLYIILKCDYFFLFKTDEIGAYSVDRVIQ